MSTIPDTDVPLRHDLSSVSRARHWAVERCSELVRELPEARRADVLRLVELLTTELVANAVEHGRPPLRLGVERLPAALRLRVADGNPDPPVRRHQQPAEATSGRGIALVEQLSRAWGAEPAAGGKVVWCDVPLDGSSPL